MAKDDDQKKDDQRDDTEYLFDEVVKPIKEGISKAKIAVERGVPIAKNKIKDLLKKKLPEDSEVGERFYKQLKGFAQDIPSEFVDYLKEEKGAKQDKILDCLVTESSQEKSKQKEEIKNKLRALLEKHETEIKKCSYAIPEKQKQYLLQSQFLFKSGSDAVSGTVEESQAAQEKNVNNFNKAKINWDQAIDTFITALTKEEEAFKQFLVDNQENLSAEEQNNLLTKFYLRQEELNQAIAEYNASKQRAFEEAKVKTKGTAVDEVYRAIERGKSDFKDFQLDKALAEYKGATLEIKAGGRGKITLQINKKDRRLLGVPGLRTFLYEIGLVSSEFRPLSANEKFDAIYAQVLIYAQAAKEIKFTEIAKTLGNDTTLLMAKKIRLLYPNMTITLPPELDGRLEMELFLLGEYDQNNPADAPTIKLAKSFQPRHGSTNTVPLHIDKLRYDDLQEKLQDAYRLSIVKFDSEEDLKQALHPTGDLYKQIPLLVQVEDKVFFYSSVKDRQEIAGDKLEKLSAAMKNEGLQFQTDCRVATVRKFKSSPLDVFWQKKEESQLFSVLSYQQKPLKYNEARAAVELSYDAWRLLEEDKDITEHYRELVFGKHYQKWGQALDESGIADAFKSNKEKLAAHRTQIETNKTEGLQTNTVEVSPVSKDDFTKVTSSSSIK